MDNTINRRSFIKGVGSGLLLAGMGGMAKSAFAKSAKGLPNFMIILCDDLGYGDLGCFGNEKIETPNLDAFAKQSMRLTDCYSAAPMCSPSRVAMLTGRTPNRTGVYDWIPPDHFMHMPKGEVTIAQLLKDAGYTTCNVGKWHCNGKFNSDEQPQPDDFGFDYWYSTQYSPDHLNPDGFVRNGEYIGKRDGYACQIVAQDAIDWLGSIRDKSKPFFQYVCFHEPHEPIMSPPELVEKYMPLARNENEAMYFACVANLDNAIGKLLKAVDDMGLAEDTIIYFTSDNGPAQTNTTYFKHSYGSAGPLRGYKRHLYDGGIRVPGIIRWPGKVKAESVSQEPVCGIDILPTFCSIAGIDSPKDRKIDGSDISPIFDGKSVDRKTPLHWHFYGSWSPPRAVLREGDWLLVGMWDMKEEPKGRFDYEKMKYIKMPKLAEFKLFNMRKDIGQDNDVSSKYPERFAKMKATLIKLNEEVKAEAPVWKDGGLVKTR